MATRRDMIKTGAGVLSPISFMDRTDAELAALAAKYRRSDDAIDAACREFGIAEKAAWRRGDEHCPRMAQINRSIDLLHETQGAVARQIAAACAASVIGVAFKLILWRLEAVKAGSAGLDQMHDAFAFSAYRDALRLTGMNDMAHPCDARTARVIRKCNWADFRESTEEED